MNRLLGCIMLFLPLLGAAQISLPREMVITARMNYVFQLKAVVDSSRWKSFNDPRYEVPLVYYTDSTSYVANPPEKFLRLVPADLIFSNSNIRVYRTRQRLNSEPFHMSTGYETGDGDSAAIYNYDTPFMSCSGYEETQRRIQDVLSVEQWATMVIHEYFHGFQYKHPALFRHAQQFLYVSSDSLRAIYKANAWFKEQVDQENAALLAALAAASAPERRKQLRAFFSIRDERRKLVKRKLGFDITPFETYYELMEGTARYAEYGLYQAFGTMPPDPVLAAADTGYHSYAYFRDYGMEQDPWLYLTEKTSYVYATGFNMVRLLEKLGVQYKATIFDKELSLEVLLRKSI